MNLGQLRFWLPIACLAVVNLFSQQFYVQRSRAVTPGTFSEMPFVSNTHALEFLKDHNWMDTVFTDSLNYSASRIQGYYVNPSPIIYLSADPYAPSGPAITFCSSPITTRTLVCLFPPRDLFAAFDRRMAERASFFRSLSFAFYPGTRPGLLDRFTYDRRAAIIGPHAQIIESLRESILNGWPSTFNSSTTMYRVRNIRQSRNHLVFVPADLGGGFGPGMFGRGRTESLFDMESDPFYPGSPLAAIGRYLLFRILAPTARIRFEFSVSITLRNQRDKLPNGFVVGRRRTRLPLIGRGAARVFSGIIAPQDIADMSFLGLDMGRSASPVVEAPRENLMKLYGARVRLDPRDITVFARDISVVDDSEYRKLTTPERISRFPKDLANPNLEFSGVYEDGWASEDSYFVLQSTKENAQLTLRGLVPLIKNLGFHARLCVTIDRAVSDCRTIGVGYFTNSYQLRSSRSARHNIYVHFDHYQVLPGRDRRPIGMKLQFIGFGT